MSNFAAIDIGTNSVRLMIASAESTAIVRETEITRLGKNVDSSNFMSEENIKKTIDVLRSYLDLCRRHEVKTICAVGTNVLRRALNSNYFIKKVYEKTGLKIRIISGPEEARFAFKGVTRGLRKTVKLKSHTESGLLKKVKDKDILTVIDIGGGSFELISGKFNGSIDAVKSIELGSVRISEKFLNKDKLQARDIFIASNIIKKIFITELSDIMADRNTVLIGVGGTISTLGSIFLGLKKYEREKLNGLKLFIKDIEDIFMQLSKLSLEDRKKIKGLQPKRADIIIGGMAILLVFMKSFKKDFLILSELDILDGIIYSLTEF